LTEQNSQSSSSEHRPVPKALRLSLFLPVAITLAVWVVGAFILVIIPTQFNLVLGLLVGISLVIYLVYWTRKARRALQVTAVLFAIPALAGITWGMIQGNLAYTFIGLAVTLVLLLVQRILNTPLSYRAAYRHFVNGRNDLALDLINRSIATRPDFWQSYQLRALLYLMRLNFHHAEQDAQAALARRPDAHPVYNTLGQIYLAQNRFTEAAEAYSSALELAPDYALYNFHLGLSQYRLGQYQAAADALAAATQGTMPLSEHDLQACYYLGRSLETLGETEQAQEAFALMAKFRDGLTPLRRDLEQQPDYLHVALQLADLADMQARLAQQEKEGVDHAN